MTAMLASPDEGSNSYVVGPMNLGWFDAVGSAPIKAAGDAGHIKTSGAGGR
jgi:hypothetical protein